MQRSRGACADTAGESTESTTSANRSAMLPRIGLRTLPLRMFARVPGTQSQAAPAVGIVGHARATSRASSISSVLHLQPSLGSTNFWGPPQAADGGDRKDSDHGHGAARRAM